MVSPCFCCIHQQVDSYDSVLAQEWAWRQSSLLNDSPCSSAPGFAKSVDCSEFKVSHVFHKTTLLNKSHCTCIPSEPLTCPRIFHNERKITFDLIKRKSGSEGRSRVAAKQRSTEGAVSTEQR